MEDEKDIIKEAEEMNLTEDELEGVGFGRVCSGLALELATSMKNSRPGSIIIKDADNIGDFTLMEKGIKHEINFSKDDTEELEPDDELLF